MRRIAWFFYLQVGLLALAVLAGVLLAFDWWSRFAGFCLAGTLLLIAVAAWPFGAVAALRRGSNPRAKAMGVIGPALVILGILLLVNYVPRTVIAAREASLRDERARVIPSVRAKAEREWAEGMKQGYTDDYPVSVELTNHDARLSSHGEVAVLMGGDIVFWRSVPERNLSLNEKASPAQVAIIQGWYDWLGNPNEVPGYEWDPLGLGSSYGTAYDAATGEWRDYEEGW